MRACVRESTNTEVDILALDKISVVGATPTMAAVRHGNDCSLSRGELVKMQIWSNNVTTRDADPIKFDHFTKSAGILQFTVIRTSLSELMALTIVSSLW